MFINQKGACQWETASESNGWLIQTLYYLRLFQWKRIARVQTTDNVERVLPSPHNINASDPTRRRIVLSHSLPLKLLIRNRLFNRNNLPEWNEQMRCWSSSPVQWLPSQHHPPPRVGNNHISFHPTFIFSAMPPQLSNIPAKEKQRKNLISTIEDR